MKGGCAFCECISWSEYEIYIHTCLWKLNKWMPTSTDSCFSLLEPYQGLYSRQCMVRALDCGPRGPQFWSHYLTWFFFLVQGTFILTPKSRKEEWSSHPLEGTEGSGPRANGYETEEIAEITAKRNAFHLSESTPVIYYLLLFMSITKIFWCLYLEVFNFFTGQTIIMLAMDSIPSCDRLWLPVSTAMYIP